MTTNEKYKQAWQQGIIIGFVSILLMTLGISVSVYLLEGWIMALQFFVFVEFLVGIVCFGMLLPTVFGE